MFPRVSLFPATATTNERDKTSFYIWEYFLRLIGYWTPMQFALKNGQMHNPGHYQRIMTLLLKSYILEMSDSHPGLTPQILDLKRSVMIR